MDAGAIIESNSGVATETTITQSKLKEFAPAMYTVSNKRLDTTNCIRPKQHNTGNSRRISNHG